jgi:hypothetical protein
MKLLNLSAFITLFSKARPSLIPSKKICRDCRHFIGDNIECRQFSNINIITGKITYDSARFARENEKKCGKEAIHFEENHFKIITVPYYFIRDNWILLIPGFAVGFYVYSMAQILHK